MSSCPHLVEGALERCAAVRGILVPSVHERERFCHGEGHLRCPTFRAHAARGSALPEELYYALWLPWGCAPDLSGDVGSEPDQVEPRVNV
jgi:hypothetical protein